MKLVLVEWIDSHSSRGWQDLDVLKKSAEPLYCRSVGWLLSETKQYKVIVPHMTGENRWNKLLQGCGDIAIPTAAIVKLTVLRRD